MERTPHGKASVPARTRLRCALARVLVSFALVVPVALRAQRVIVLQAGPSPMIRATPHGKLVIPIVLNMTEAGGGDLAALTATVAWSHARLTLDSVTAGGFGSLTSNTSKAATGSATFSVFNVTGTSRTVTVAQLFFTASATTGASDIALTPSVAGNEVGQPILSLMRSRPLRVCVAEGSASCPPPGSNREGQ